MNTPSILSTSLLSFFLIVIILSFFCPSHSHGQQDLLKCLGESGISGLVYTPSNSSYLPILNLPIRNQRFSSPSTPKPVIIVTPEHERDISATVLCSKEHGYQTRTRSGGHDFEGVSYTSYQSLPFVVIDLYKLNSITIDVRQATAWVEGGATLGQLYYEISRVSGSLAFPAGFCPTVGVGGHFTGGGFGQLFRKYGLAIDHVIDARLVDANGDILDRESMSEDLFWAIRGGGGGSFGIITAWKIRLVHVPQVVTACSVTRSSEQDVTELVRKWQSVAPELPEEIYFAVIIRSVNSGGPGGKTIQATFNSSFLGGANEFLELFGQRFPELGVRREDCLELSWIRSVLYFAGYSVDEPTKILASRIAPEGRVTFKAKSDYVPKPLTTSELEGLWNFLHEYETGQALFIANGGIENEISPSVLPYPHRGGHLYQILYRVFWDQEETEISHYISWIRRLYDYMTPYVTQLPRAVYVNYRDLDLGVNDEGNANNAQIPTWGFQYFRRNFIRLMRVKSVVDPDNFFRHEQSIPTLPLTKQRSKENDLMKAIS